MVAQDKRRWLFLGDTIRMHGWGAIEVVASMMGAAKENLTGYIDVEITRTMASVEASSTRRTPEATTMVKVTILQNLPAECTSMFCHLWSFVAQQVHVG